MRLKLETRAEPSRLMGWLAPLFAAVLTVVAGFILFSALGKNPVQARVEIRNDVQYQSSFLQRCKRCGDFGIKRPRRRPGEIFE